LPADRFKSSAQFAEALVTPLSGGSASHATGGDRSSGGTLSRIIRNPWWAWGTAMALGAAAIALGSRGVLETGPTPTMRFGIELDPAQDVQGTAVVHVTPDGNPVIARASVGQTSVLISRRLDQMQAVVIAGSDLAERPFLSPDGRFVAFSTIGKLVKIPVEGGTPIQIGESTWGGGSWNSKGEIAFPRNYQSGIWIVNEAGGAARKLTDPDTTAGELGHWWPQWLPDNRTILFTAYRTPISKASIEAVNAVTGERKVVIEGGVMARYLRTGHLLFTRGETVLAVALDLERLEAKGAPTVVIEDVFTNFSDGYASWDVSPAGTLAFITTATAGLRTDMVSVDRQGAERTVVPTPDRYDNPRWAPDGRRISFDTEASRQAADVWVYDAARGSRIRITSEEAADFGAAWTPDGKDLVYMTERPLFELYRRSADASRPTAPLLTGSKDRIMGGIAPNGIMSFIMNETAGTEIWSAPFDEPGRASKYLANGFQLGHPVVSPDGGWMAYDSNEGGRLDVFLQSYPDPTKARVQVSSDGGAEPAWTRGGRELAFRRGDTVMVAAVDPVTGNAAKPTVLFSGPYKSMLDWTAPRSYDVTADGERFLMLRFPPGGARNRVNVVTNWFAELRQKVPR
jgi:serine/threonine-protein kinase